VLLTITMTGESATDLGFLLHKHPERVQRFDVTAGAAHVFYPEYAEGRATVALLLEVDPIALVRGRAGRDTPGFALAQYVNDRPYAASSMLAVAMGRVFRTAMNGRCDARPSLPQQPQPLRIQLPALPCAGGATMAERVFAPLGWSVAATPVPLDPTVPAWGDSRYVELCLTGRLRLADALNHLYVLLPVLDNAKHYWVSSDEVDKLIRAGDGWLRDHPERDLITARYLAHQRSLVRTAVGRLAEIDDARPETLDNAVPDDAPGDPDGTAPRRVSLAEQRRTTVVEVLRAAGASRVVDCGCGDGSLLRPLLADPAFTEILGVDVSHRALEFAARRLRLEQLGDRQRERIRLVQSSVTYRDDRLAGFDAIVLMEVVEHVDPDRLPALERTVFGAARPRTVVVTTPNVEYNVRYPDLPAGALRHPDHRFEWTRDEFRRWADRAAAGSGYTVRHLPVGGDDPEVGPPTQLAVFTRVDDATGVPA
jgi:3' terminal RNA ribose 2'-O-methyltransferase Hen1